MDTTPPTNVDERLRLLAEELAMQADGADSDAEERIAYLEEAMAGARLTRRFTSRPAGGMPG